MNELKINQIEVKSILSKSNLPACEYSVNPYVGCPHACKYCYASFMKRFTGHTEEWGDFIDIKRCAKPINVKKLYHKSVFLSSVTDCYNPFEEKYRLTRNILEQLVDVDCILNILRYGSLFTKEESKSRINSAYVTHDGILRIRVSRL